MRTLLRGATTTLVVRGGGYALSFALLILLARLLGKQGFGTYAYVMSWLYVCFLIAKFGWDHTLVRFVAVYRKTDQWALLAGILRASTWFAGVVSTLISLGIALGILLADLDAGVSRTAWMATLALPFFVLGTLRQATLRALLHVGRAQLPEVVLRPLVAGAAVLLIAAISQEALQPWQAMGCFAGATAFAFLVGATWLARAIPEPLRNVRPDYELGVWIRVSLPMMLLSGAYVVMSETDTIMIGGLLGAEHAGLYSAANRVSMILLFGLTAVASIVAPMAAGFFARGDSAAIQRIVRVSTIAILTFTLPLAAGLAVWGDAVLSIFGHDFRAGTPALRILLLGNTVNAIVGPVGALLTMTGNHLRALVVVLAGAGANIILNALFIPKWGIVGAAIATTSTMIAWNLVLAVLVFRQLRIKPSLASLFRASSPKAAER